MQARFGPRLRRGALALGLAAGLAPPAPAATVLAYDFDAPGGGARNAPSVLAPPLTAGPWYDTALTLAAVEGPDGWAVAASGWALGNAFLFEVTVDPGLALDLQAVAFEHAASAGGPAHWWLALDGWPAAAGPIAPAGSLAAWAPLDLPGLQGAFLVALGAFGAQDQAALWRVDDFTLQGRLRPVPLPGALGPLAAALALLAAIARPLRKGPPPV